MQVMIRIGAALSGGFRSAVGDAVRGLGQVEHGVGQLSGKLLDVGQAWVGMHTIKGLVHDAGDLEHRLMQTGITADLSAEEIANLRDQMRDLAVPERTNQSVDDLLRGYTALVSAGMDKAAATAAIESLGRSATAAGADVEDMAKTAFVLVDALKVAPGALTAELDRLTYAGKQGAFELRDMARYFPVLGASAQAMGLRGSQAVSTLGAALQYAKKGAAEPGEAANNLQNLFAKIQSPETLKKFKGAGINITKVIKDAVGKGENPFDAVLDQINKVTKGGQVDLLGKFFGDMQVQNAMKPMLDDVEGYKRLKADIDKKSTGTVDQDYARIMTTFAKHSEAASNAMTKLGDSIGKALLPPLGGLLRLVTPVIGHFADMAESSPGWTASILEVGAAMATIPPVLRLIGLTASANPIGAAVAGLAVAASWSYDHWTEIQFFFLHFWDFVEYRWGEFASFVGAIWAQISGPLDSAKSFLGLGSALPAPGPAAGAAPAAPGSALAEAEAKGAAASRSGGAGAAAAAAPTGQVDVKVTVDGLPRGSTTETRSRGAAVGEVDTHTGYQMAVP